MAKESFGTVGRVGRHCVICTCWQTEEEVLSLLRPLHAALHPACPHSPHHKSSNDWFYTRKQAVKHVSHIQHLTNLEDPEDTDMKGLLPPPVALFAARRRLSISRGLNAAMLVAT